MACRGFRGGTGSGLIIAAGLGERASGATATLPSLAPYAPDHPRYGSKQQECDSGILPD